MWGFQDIPERPCPKILFEVPPGPVVLEASRFVYESDNAYAGEPAYQDQSPLRNVPLHTRVEHARSLSIEKHSTDFREQVGRIAKGATSAKRLKLYLA